MSKEMFKRFMKNNPELLAKINNGEMTFQKYYEIYDLYGEDQNIWKEYKVATVKEEKSENTSFQEILNIVKKVDLNTVKKGVNGLQRAIGLVQELGIGTTKIETEKTYEERPVYQRMED